MMCRGELYQPAPSWFQMKLLVGLVGRKRSGKDTLAGFIRETDPGVTIMSFADPLKQACKHAYHLTDDQLEETKDVVDPRWGMSPRDMMKSIGTKYFRVEDPGHWIKNLGIRMSGIDSVVVSDVRFHNEALFIRENGGVLVHVSRKIEGNDDDHVSECTSDEIDCGYYISNNGSLEDLRVQLDLVLRTISGGCD